MPRDIKRGMSQELLSYAEADGIATVTMDDGKANALSPAMLERLEAAFDRAEKDARAVVIAGRDGRFCAGFDLKVVMSGPDAARDLVRRGGELLLRLYELPLPVVVACTGHALAAGALLAATGDTRVGALGQLKIGLKEVANGMPVPVLAHELVRDRLRPSELFASVVHARIDDPSRPSGPAGWTGRCPRPRSSPRRRRRPRASPASRGTHTPRASAACAGRRSSTSAPPSTPTSPSSRSRPPTPRAGRVGRLRWADRSWATQRHPGDRDRDRGNPSLDVATARPCGHLLSAGWRLCFFASLWRYLRSMSASRAAALMLPPLRSSSHWT